MQEWSGKRDSNPQPSAWKADALAVELFPHFRGALSQASLADPRASACPVLHRSSRQSTCLLQPRQLLACATLLVQKWWRGVDLNHRSLTTTDLQSVPFGHSGTPPRLAKTRRSAFRLQPEKERDLHRPADLEIRPTTYSVRTRAGNSGARRHASPRNMELAMGLEPATC